jgi:hypothetical protein
MPCFYCGKRVSLVRQLTDADFCSEEHRKKYHELTRMALNRLVESQEQLSGAPLRRKGPLPATSVTEPSRPVPEEARIPVPEERRIPFPEERRIPFPEERRIPVPEERRMPLPEERPAPAAKRPAPVIVTPPPAPPPPPRPRLVREPSSEAGFILRPVEASTMDDGPWMGGEIELRSEAYALGRFAPARRGVSLRVGGPVWPKLNPETLKMAGRARLVRASGWSEFAGPGLQRAYAYQWPPRLAVGEPGAGTLFRHPRPAGLTGQLSARSPIATSIDSQAPVILTRVVFRPVRAVFPSGDLNTSYARPAFQALRFTLRAEPAPGFSVGFRLPERPREAAVRRTMLALEFLASSMPARVNMAAAARWEVRPAGFAQPAIWLPESDFSLVTATRRSVIESMVGEWIVKVPLPLRLPRVLRVVPAPRRSPRPAIPMSPGWTHADRLPSSDLVPGGFPLPVGARWVVPAMTWTAQPAEFTFSAVLPAAEREPRPDLEVDQAPREAAHARLAPPAAVRALQNARLAAEQVPPAAPAVSLPLPTAPESLMAGALPNVAALAPLAQPPAMSRARVADADLRRGAPPFSAATPVLPELAGLGEGCESVPIEAAYMPVSLPSSVRGRRSGPLGAGQPSLPGSSIAPLLPATSAAPLTQRLLALAPLSPGGLSSALRPLSAQRGDIRGFAPPSFEVAALLPETPKRAYEVELGPGSFSVSPPAPTTRSSAAAVAGGAPLSGTEPVQVLPVALPEFEHGLAGGEVIPEAVTPTAAVGQRVRAVFPGLDFAPELETPESAGGFEIRVPGAEYAAALAARPATTRPQARTVGPMAAVCDVSLPTDGTLASTAFLAPAEGFTRRPLPIAGAAPQSVADLAPRVPPLADPQVAPFERALAERAGISSSDLQSPGTPRAQAKPAQPRPLPRAEIPAPDLLLLDTPAPTARHALPELAIIPASITPAVRERHPAESLRQDVPVPEPRLPELGAAEREHVLGSGALLEAPVAAASAKAHWHPPAGAITREIPPEFPAPVAFSTAVWLGAGEPSDLEVRAAAWTLASHPMGWAAFAPNEAQVLDPRPGVLGAIVLSVSGLETAEYAAARAARPATTRPQARTVGPMATVCEVSLPTDGTLASTAFLAPAGGFTRRPMPIAGAAPQSVADLAPRVPPLADPQVAPFERALAERAGISSSELQSPGMPRAQVRPAQPRPLPRAEILAWEPFLLETPAASARHALPELAIIPASITPAVRERHPAESLRQDVPVPEPRLPELGAAEREHVLGSGALLEAPVAAASAKAHWHPPAGAITREIPPEFPAPVAFSTAVWLGAGEPSDLEVRAAAWTLASHPMGWAAFGPNEAQVLDPRPGVLGAIVLSVSGLEKLDRPLPKAPVAASTLRSLVGFPLAEPLRQSTPVAEEPHELEAMPSAALAPPVFRGTPQAPWTTSATIPTPPAGLPDSGLGVPARLYVAGEGFEAPVPARPLGAATPDRARKVAVPIRLSDYIQPPEARLAPVHPLLLTSAEVLRAVEFPAAQKVVSRPRPLAAAEFALAGPVHAESQVIAACHTLGQSAPWAVGGRTQVGALKVSAPAPAGFVSEPTELPGPRAVDITVCLMAAGSERVPPRTYAGAPAREAVGWQALERDCTSTHFRSVESHLRSLEWPTRVAGCFQVKQRPPVFGVRFRVASPSGTEFPCPAVLWPESAGFTQALRPTPLSVLSAPPRREDTLTARRTVRLEPVFRLIRRPGRLPVFHTRERRAAMPSGVFRYVEAHEDFEDYGTMGMAPRGEAPLPNPVIPAAEHRISFSEDVDCPYFMPPIGLTHDLSARPAGAFEFRVTPPRPLLEEGVDPIPVEYDPRLAEAGKSQGLVGALKSASRFFKFTALGVPGLMLLSALLGGAPGDSTRQMRAAAMEENFRKGFGNGFTTMIDGKKAGFRSDYRLRAGGAGSFSDSREGRMHPGVSEGGVAGRHLG